MKKGLLRLVGLGCLGLLVACGNLYISNEDKELGSPSDGWEGPALNVDNAFWFGDIYEDLVVRVGELSSEDYSGTPPMGMGSGQIVSRKYVIDSINQQWGITLPSITGDDLIVADCEYYLKMIDKANLQKFGYQSAFGTSKYATKQIIDNDAIDKSNQELYPTGNKFVAVGTRSMVSQLGNSWTLGTTTEGNGRAIAYGNGLYVIIRSNGLGLAYSDNAIDWIDISGLPANRKWQAIVYGNGVFIAVSDFNFYGGVIICSSDGINWTKTDLSGRFYNMDSGDPVIAYGNGRFVIMNSYKSDSSLYPWNIAILYSDDKGTSWVNIPTISNSNNFHVWSLCYGNGRWIAITRYTYTTNGTNLFYKTIICSSSDGITWTKGPAIAEKAWTAIAYGNGRFIVTSRDGVSLISNDGINWSIGYTFPSYEGSFVSRFDIAYGNGRWVAVGNKHSYYSDDMGISWSEVGLGILLSPSNVQQVGLVYNLYNYE